MKAIFAAVIATYCLLQVTGRTVKERLLHDLTDDYEPAIDPGVIDLQMKIVLLCSWLDNSTGFVVSQAWESYTWRDERLSWSPDEYAGVSQLNVPSKFVWIPDMRQYRTTTSEVERDDDLNVVLMSDGNIIWIPRVTYRSACSENDNKLTCEWRVGSWTYDGNNVRLQAQGSEGLDLSHYQSACPLSVDNHTAAVVSHTYACCEEPYPSMDVSIVFNK